MVVLHGGGHGRASMSLTVTVTWPLSFSVSITGGRRPISSSASASSIFGSGGNGKEKLFLQDIAELIRAGACQKAVVMVGAGVSTPSGIPDFRCPAVPRSSLTTLVRCAARLTGLRASCPSLQVSKERPVQQPAAVRPPIP